MTTKTTIAQTNNTQTAPQTLLEFAGVQMKPSRLSESVLVMIDAQKEFTEGKLMLPEIEAALKEARKLLDRARKAGIPVIHVRHRNKSGAALFNPDTKFVEPIDLLLPQAGEIIVNKSMANAFADSRLDEELNKTARKKLIIFGYMTHMAVDATVRAALERGFQTTIVGNACATRDLSDGYGSVIPARQVHQTSLAALRDRFAFVVRSEIEIAD